MLTYRPLVAARCKGRYEEFDRCSHPVCAVTSLDGKQRPVPPGGGIVGEITLVEQAWLAGT